MGEEGFQDSFMPAGKQTCEETGKEDGGQRKDTSCCSAEVKPASKSNSLSDKREAVGEEDEDEARGEKSSEESLLLRKNSARTHLQVLGETQGRGDD